MQFDIIKGADFVEQFASDGKYFRAKTKFERQEEDIAKMVRSGFKLEGWSGAIQRLVKK